MSLSFPLTTMEEFLYWEDRPAYPWSCFVRLQFSGCLDRIAFEAAVRTVLARHPLLAAKVESVGRGRLQWSVVEDPSPVIRWETAAVGGPLPPATHQDLRREIGIRFHVRAEAAASDVTIQFHHACCDGLGIASFIRDLLVAYAMAFGPVPQRTRLPPLDTGKLARRGRFGLTLGKLLGMAPRQLAGLLGAWQFLMRSPVPVIPCRACADDAPLPSSYPATLHHVLDVETTAGLRRASLREGVTRNDLLARDFFLALAEWRSRQNLEDGQWLRMMVPMNLRTVNDRLLPAANVVSSVFLDRRAPDFADAGRLLRGIHEEMSLIKRLDLGFTFVFSLEACRRFLGGLKKKVRADKCTISCIFTNLGNAFDFAPFTKGGRRGVAGNVKLENIDLAAPVRPYSCVSLIVGLYARKLSINLHYDPRPLSQEQASDLLAAYVRRIHASVAGCSVSLC